MLQTKIRTDETGHVRPMARHDLAVVAGLMARRARRHGLAPAIDIAGLEADLFGPTPLLHGLVAERFGFVVGYALMLPRYRAEPQRRILDLDQLFVLESSQGLGLGRKLVESVVHFGRREGFALLAADARCAAFYGKLGFVSTGDGEPGLVQPIADEAEPLRMPA